MRNHWSAFWVALISMIVGVLVAFLSGLFFEPVILASDIAGNKPTWADAFGFAGVIITILAFVGAFFILFTALDAFAVSKETEKNRTLLEENTRLVETQSKVSKRLESQLGSFAETSSNVQRELLIFQAMVAEFSSFNVDFSTNINSQIDYLSDRLGVPKEIKLIRGSKEYQMRGMARLDALSALAAGNPEDDVLERGNTAFIELLESARTGETVDQLILLLMDHSQLSTLNEEDRAIFLANANDQTLFAIGQESSQ